MRQLSSFQFLVECRFDMLRLYACRGSGRELAFLFLSVQIQRLMGQGGREGHMREVKDEWCEVTELEIQGHRSSA